MSTQNKTSTISGAPVLLYHAVTGEDTSSRADRFAVSIDNFRTQVQLLADMGCVTLDDIRTNARGRRGRVAITFDDGLESDFTVAFPLLQEHGLVSHFFINTANVGLPGYMNWEQIRQLSRAGMHIGSHGHRHISLTEANDKLLLSELTRSREMLEDELGTEVSWFAAPYGLVNARLFRIAQQIGYTGVCTSRCWPAREGAYTMPRVAISRSTSFPEFRSLVQGERTVYWGRNLLAGVKYVPRRILVKVRPSLLGVTVSRQLS